MKKIVKIILVLSCVLFSLEIYAQDTKDYVYCSYQIDSLSKIYSVDSIVKINDYFSFRDAKLSDKEKEKLIGKIRKLFEQKQYINLYIFGGDLINRLYFQRCVDG